MSSFFVIFANQIFPAKNCPSPPGIPPILASAIPSLKGTLTQHNLMKLLAFRLCAPELPSCTLPNCQLCAHRMPHCDDSNLGAYRWQSVSIQVAIWERYLAIWQCSATRKWPICYILTLCNKLGCYVSLCDFYNL